MLRISTRRLPPHRDLARLVSLLLLTAGLVACGDARQDAAGELLRLNEALQQHAAVHGRFPATLDLDTGGQFNAIDPSSGWKADLIVRRARPFSESEFARRQHRELFGVEVALATLEDLIIAKLEWSELGNSELPRRDIRELLEIAGDAIDRGYLEHWIEVLDLRNPWDRISEST